MTSLAPKKEAAEARTFSTRDIVLAKLKGYPQWPAMVVDPESVPEKVTEERPGGNKHYCVRFFPAGDYAWLIARDISALKREDIERFIQAPKGAKRSGELLKGYQVALDPTAWEATINDEIAKRIADESRDDGDGMEEEDEDDSYGKKKRRRSSVGKTPDGAKKKRRTSKKNGLSAETVESEDDAAAAAPIQEKNKKKDDDDERYAHLKNDPGAAHIKSVRHALQKTFLSKTTPSDKDLESSDTLFKELETNEIKVEYLTYSKIGKVMRHIASLDDAAIPREGEFGFKRRAGDLVSKWHKVANASNQRASLGGPIESPVLASAGANGNGNGAPAGLMDVSMQQ
ncbi:Tudor/PWWP/MBT [Auricularia subglabra TFB-10046 SS5]|nr:Tudor/PWWP/MBT [Auricularia subglabra TFB-10046 SS5]